MDTDAGDLFERLARIKRHIGAIGKNRSMTAGQSYNYRGIEDILNAAHEALVEEEVTIAPYTVHADYQDREARGGTKMIWCSIEVEWMVACPTGGVALATIGEAMDTSDKASNKAQTAAFKVLLGQLFAIPYTDIDPDQQREELAASSSSAPAHITTDQYGAIMARIHDLPDYMKDAIRPLVVAGPKLDYLPPDQYGEAMAFLELCEAELEAPADA